MTVVFSAEEKNVYMFRCMYLDGGDVDKIIAQTNAYLATR